MFFIKNALHFVKYPSFFKHTFLILSLIASAVKGISTASDFTVFPNPSNGSAKITISDISEPTDVQLLDISGRIIKNISVNSSNTVELNNLQKGMYMIRIVNKSSEESVTQKLTVIN